MNTAGPVRKFRHDIHGLRAIAVLLVVLFHSVVPGFSGGFVGVDVFFVISGYLITKKIVNEKERGTFTLRGFYAGRVRRLLPSALAVVLVTLILGRLLAPVTHVRGLSHDAMAAALSVTNFWLIDQKTDYLQQDSAESALTHFWSLAVEEQFYLAWPLLILAAFALASWWKRPSRSIMFLIIGVVIVASGAASVWITATDPTTAYYAPHTRAWELAIGGLIALPRSMWQQAPGWLAATTGWAGALTVLLAAAVYSHHTPYPSFYAAFPALGTAAVIAAGHHHIRWGVGRALSGPVLQFLGTHSYAWYLWHWPMIVLLPYLADGADSWPALLLFSGVALGLAVATHYLVEQPALRFSMPTGRWLAAGAGATACMVGLGAVSGMYMPQQRFGGRDQAVQSLDPTSGVQISQVIAKSLEVKQPPRNIRPEPTVAAESFPVTTTDGCHVNEGTNEGNECLYGDLTSDRTIALFGDSHAEQYISALDPAAKELGYKVTSHTKSGCSPNEVPLIYEGKDITKEDCADWRIAKRDLIVEKRPDLVVISHFESIGGDAGTPEGWGDSSRALAEHFTERDIPVLFILDPPTPTKQSPDCITVKHDVPACNYNRVDGYRHYDRHEAIRDSLQEAGIATVEASSWTCTGDDCAAVIGPFLVFRDDHHLTREFVEYLTPLFVTELEKHLPNLNKHPAG